MATEPISSAPISGVVPTVEIHGPLPPDDPLYALIGRVVAEWAQLEHVLDLTIWELAEGRKDIGSCITGQMMGHAPRFKAIAALAELRGHDKKVLSEIELLKNKVFGIAELRNRYIHDAWYSRRSTQDTSEVAQFRSYSVKHDKFGLFPIETDQIEKCIKKIRSRTKAMSKLRTRLSHKSQP